MSGTDSPLTPNSLLDGLSGPDFSIEGRFAARGYRYIAGVDEAGRGPLAGPVVAAAVVLDAEAIPQGLNDSKKLTAQKRKHLFHQILNSSHVGWASVAADTIDQINIREATLLAMTKAVHALPVIADASLIDGRDVPRGLLQTGQAFVKGDGRSLSIAAASIVAKYVRDQIMLEAHSAFPVYGFASHKGYGSQIHRDAIAEYGPCPLHRKSFAPLRQMLAANNPNEIK